MRKEDYLGKLGLSPLSSLDEVRRAKRYLLMQFHPDVNPHSAGHAENRTREILEAYDALMRIWEEPMRRVPQDAEYSTGPAPASASKQQIRTFLVFSIADYSLALDSMDVREVIPLNRLFQEGDASSVPNRVNWRGKSMIIIDPRRAMKISCADTPRKAKVIAVSAGGSAVGIIVDEVDGLKKIPASDLLADQGESGLPAGFCKGSIKSDLGYSFVLSLEKLFTA